ncbi:ATP-binding protein [Streptomyces sp. NPDC059080]|uniref:ATP-binding protein n=1 Tax=Streptomyces sp. NPDC059080 TaxID=3346718 RepID=UPI0036AE7E40
MSLPVTRRIARAALLVAASAAPVVAAAGSATAAPLPSATDLGGLTTLDSPHTSETVDQVAHEGVGLVNEAGGAAAGKLAPALVETAGPLVQRAAPTTQHAADTVGNVLSKTGKDGLSTDTLPTNAVKGVAGSLPTQGKGLLGGLPLGG